MGNGGKLRMLVVWCPKSGRSFNFPIGTLDGRAILDAVRRSMGVRVVGDVVQVESGYGPFGDVFEAAAAVADTLTFQDEMEYECELPVEPFDRLV